MTEVGCPFCNLPPERVFLAEELVVGLWDAFPVSPGHALLVPRRHTTDWFSATPDERAALTLAIEQAKQIIERDHRPDGYNIGFNVGVAAGQTIWHLHVHLIPRYAGDVTHPRGGALGTRHSVLGTRHSALGTRHSALGSVLAYHP